MQDGLALATAYLTKRVADAAANETTQGTVCRHFNALGLVNPSEPTSAKIAAFLAVARWGPTVATQAPEFELQHIFTWVKKELKRLYKHEPMQYVLYYPPTAVEFLRAHPQMAKAAFSAEDLPISSPLSEAAIGCVFNRIQQRGYSQTKDQTQALTWLSVMRETTPTTRIRTGPSQQHQTCRHLHLWRT